MINNMKKIRLTVFSILSLWSSTTLANWPVIDISNLTQAIKRYVTELKQYEQEMQQTALSNSELAETIKVYQQAYTSYNEVMRQMQQLQNKMDPNDYKLIFNQYRSILSSPPSAARWLAAKSEESKYLYQGKSEQELTNTIDAIPYANSAGVISSAQQIRAQGQLAASQRAAYDGMVSITEARAARINQVEQERKSLGSEDTLKTQQVIAEQNSLLIEGQQQLIQQGNAQLLYGNQLSGLISSGAAESQDTRLESIKNNLSRPVTIQSYSSVQ